MSISYGELAVIGNMTNDELVKEYYEQAMSEEKISEETRDTLDAILMEMESRGLEHP